MMREIGTFSLARRTEWCKRKFNQMYFIIVTFVSSFIGHMLNATIIGLIRGEKSVLKSTISAEKRNEKAQMEFVGRFMAGHSVAWRNFVHLFGFRSNFQIN